MARWATIFRLARRDAQRAKVRTALTVGLMALPVAAITFISGLLATTTFSAAAHLQLTLGETTQARVTAPMPNIADDLHQDAIGYQIQHGDITGEPVDPAAIAAIAPGQVTEALRIRFNAETDSALIPHLFFYEVDADRVPGLFGQVEGNPTPAAGEAVIPQQLAKRLGIGVGDLLTLRAQQESISATIVGVGNATNEAAQGIIGPGTTPPAENAAAPDDSAWFITGDEPVTWEHIQELNAAGFVVESREMLANPPSDRHSGTFESKEPDLRMVGFLITVLSIGLLEAILLVAPAFAVGAKRNARSLALVSASGGGPRDLRGIVLASGLVAGILAAIVGLGLGFMSHLAWYVVASRSIYPPGPFAVSFLWPVGGAIGALLLGLIAAWIPAVQASRTNVIAALSGRRADVAAKGSLPWVGLAIIAAGVVSALVGTASTSPPLLAAGAVATLLGAVISSSAFIRLAGSFAPRTRFPTRFALRDAARHRSRSAPALAAVLAAVAIATGGLIVTTSEEYNQARNWTSIASPGTGVIYISDIAYFSAIADDITEAVRGIVPEAQVTQARELLPTQEWEVWQVHAQTMSAPCDDCEEPEAGTAGLVWNPYSTLIDDGTLISQNGLEGSPEAAGALAAGRVLVNSETHIDDEGKARLTVMDSSGEETGQDLLVDAHLVSWRHPSYELVLPPALAEQILTSAERDHGEAPLMTAPVGALITGVALNQEQQDSLAKALSEISEDLRLEVEGRSFRGGETNVTALIIGATIIVALFATLLSIGLAMADSRSDLATASAVGAGPRIRRRIVASQAGVISVLGTACGMIAGLALGYVLTNWQISPGNPTWSLVIPWLPIAAIAIGIPALAMAMGWLFAPAKLPLRARTTE